MSIQKNIIVSCKNKIIIEKQIEGTRVEQPTIIQEPTLEERVAKLEQLTQEQFKIIQELRLMKN